METGKTVVTDMIHRTDHHTHDTVTFSVYNFTAAETSAYVSVLVACMCATGQESVLIFHRDHYLCQKS